MVEFSIDNLQAILDVVRVQFGYSFVSEMAVAHFLHRGLTGLERHEVERPSCSYISAHRKPHVDVVQSSSQEVPRRFDDGLDRVMGIVVAPDRRARPEAEYQAEERARRSRGSKVFMVVLLWWSVCERSDRGSTTYTPLSS